MKKLPIGTQSFSILRSIDYLYVDKTEYIYKMIELEFTIKQGRELLF